MTATRPSTAAGQAPSGPTPLRRHYPELEGYRAIAAIAVVIYHFSNRFWFGTDALMARTLGRWGDLGVCLFFLLSGFVLYRPRVVAMLDGRRNEPLRHYLAFRILRIVPAYWLALTFMIVALWHVNPYEVPGWQGSVPWGDHVRYFGFLQIYDPATAVLGLGVAWTLCVEMLFYLTLPALAWGLAKISTRPHRVGGSAADTTSAHSAASDLHRFRRRQLIGITVLGAIGIGFRWWMFRSPATVAKGVTWPIGYITWFAAGMALATSSVLVERGAAPARAVRLLLGNQRGGLGVALAATIALAVTVEPVSFLQTATDLQVRFVLSIVVAAGLLGPIVLAGTPRHGPVERFLRAPTMQYLGRISYGIYLWHWIWIRVVDLWVDQGIVPAAWPVEAMLVAVLTLCAAAVTFEAVEAPVMRWKRSLRGASPP